MDVGLTIAASGMLAEQLREDQLANDLSNASTAGYKSEDVEQSAFGAMVLPGGSGNQPLGTIDTGTEITRELPNLQQGSLQSTGEPLDFAISGAGFFAVKTPTGVSYTRDGQFTASASGDLVDADGDPVLSQTGAAIKVAADGTVPASALGVFALASPAELGNNLFGGTAQGRASGTVQSGALEGSNIDAARTMVDMMSALSNYQSGEQAIQTIGQVDQSAAASVGSLSGA